MKYICPLITVSDIGRSRDFYERILGQKVKYDYGENVTFEGDFAIHLRSHFKELINNKKIKSCSNNFELYFEHDDPDKLVEKLKDHGVTFIHEMREQPWRQRVVRFYDPDNNIIEVGESLEHLSYRLNHEGMTAGEISGIISMPEIFVKKSIEKYEAFK
ncbi:MAG: VOC family protein [Bacteroidales bacterium]|nr:VOC family protein [Bacteroidales bacterium]